MPSKSTSLSKAPFALRVTQRKSGLAAIVYRRQADSRGRDRLQRLGDVPPLAYQAALPLLRQAVRASRLAEPGRNGNEPDLAPGPYLPLDAQWGVRVACYAIITTRLYDGERMMLAAEHLRHADPDLLAWWLGLLLQRDNSRALRALRILTEAVR